MRVFICRWRKHLGKKGCFCNQGNIELHDVALSFDENHDSHHLPPSPQCYYIEMSPNPTATHIYSCYELIGNFDNPYFGIEPQPSINNLLSLWHLPPRNTWGRIFFKWLGNKGIHRVGKSH